MTMIVKKICCDQLHCMLIVPPGLCCMFPPGPGLACAAQKS